MPEEVLFEDESKRSRAEAAEYLRGVADRLDSGSSVTFERGSESVTVEVPDTVEFEVKIEREGPTDGPKDIGLELELEWPEGAAGEEDGSLSIR
ncbi:amphi-Trp domain-containing protein [Halobacteriales archaeon QS_4_69_31]|jgi:amphi-Trp domain-containing protein|nr:MAG: amphi-Trp domain-containing protein [Halobacteriales archaeon QS_4_69_31]